MTYLLIVFHVLLQIWTKAFVTFVYSATFKKFYYSLAWKYCNCYEFFGAKMFREFEMFRIDA